MKKLANRLAAKYLLRQVDVSLRAEQASRRAESSVRSVWAKILELLRCGGSHQQCFRDARSLFFQLFHSPIDVISRSLQATHKQARARTVRELKPVAREVAAEPVQESTFPSAVQDLLIQAPSARFILDAVFGSGWRERFAALSSLASPDAMAQTVSNGLLFGRLPAEIARDLLPMVEQVRSSAKRVARTETLRVAHAAQMQAHEQLGDLVVGYQIHATLDERTRPKHAARSGRVWFKDSPRSMTDALMMSRPELPDEHN